METWRKIRLGDACVTNTSSYSAKEGWKFVNYLDTGNITENRIDSIWHIDLEDEKLPSRAKRKVRMNSIIYSTVRPNQRHFGIIKMKPENFLVSTGFVVIDVDTDIIDADFLYYLLAQPVFVEMLHAIAEQSTSAYPSIKPSDIENLEIEIPSLTTQKAIASVLGSLDKKVNQNAEINKNLEQQISSIYANLCENKSWNSCELGSLIDVRDGTHDSPKPQSDGYLLVTSKHLLPYGVDRITPNRIAKKDFKKINERSLVEPGDVLMSMIGTIGLISFVADQTIDYAIKNVALFKTSKTPELAYYFLTFLKSKKTQQYIEMCLAGSTQKYISLGELRKMPIPDPASETLERFNKIVRPMYQTIILNTQENNAFAELRDSLLPQLMSGELDVSDIDI